jgi:hypothetical protein
MSAPSSNPFSDLPDPQRSFPPEQWPSQIVKAELAESGPPDPGERISILYLMVWTAGSAVILAFYRQSMSLTQGQPASPFNPTWLQTAYAVLMSPLQGAGVAAVGLMMWRRFRGGPPFPRQPGHWLLVISGVTALLSWPVYLITHQLFQNGRSAYLVFYLVPLMFVFYALAAYAMTKMPGEPRWRKMFLIWILANVVILLGMCCFGNFGYVNYGNWWGRFPDLLIGVAVPLAFLITGILDKAVSAKRDHLHWAGVACRVAMIGQVAIEIVRMCLPRP